MKVTLLGDSIREQYAPRVAELLGDGFEVWTPKETADFPNIPFGDFLSGREP